ncbi:MAG: cytochrome c [Candidatus Zixiibacteriota bacterium]|nr:MAG: cytochrome c [candidate division Zixibacteria bacterium]
MKAYHMALAAAALILLSGCGSGRRTEPLRGPLQIESQEVAQGQKHFMDHCHQCHPQGSGGVGPSIVDKPLPDIAIRTQIRQGVGAMPAFSEEHLSDSAVDQILAYINALQDNE